MASQGGGIGASSSAIRAGGAFVELFTKDSGLSRGLDRAAARVRAWGVGMAGVGSAVLAPLVAAGKFQLDHAVKTQRFATKLGTSTEEVSRLGYAAETTGMTFEELIGQFENFDERVAQGALGTGEGAVAFKQLGISAEDMLKKTRTEQLMMVADAMEKLGTNTERMGVLSKLGGDKFQNMDAILRGGRGTLQALIKESDEYGATLSSEDAKIAADANRELIRTWTAIKSVLAAVGTAVLTTGTHARGLAGGVAQAAAAARTFIRENAGIIVGAVVATAALVGLGVAVTGVGIALSAAGTIIGVVTGVATFLLSPIGLLTVGLAGLVAAVVYFADVGKSFGDTWGGIMAALKSGDLALAAEIGLAGLEVEWLRAKNWLMGQWDSFLDYLGPEFEKTMTRLSLIANNVSAALQTTFASFFDFIDDQLFELAALIAAEFDDVDEETIEGKRQQRRQQKKTPEQIAQDIDNKRLIEEDKILRKQKTAAQDRKDAALARGQELRGAEQALVGLEGRALLKQVFDEIHRGGGDAPKPKIPDGMNRALSGMARGSFNTMGYGSQAFGGPRDPVPGLIAQGNAILGNVNNGINKLLQKTWVFV